ncbi:MAG TPA: hypothetical protein VH558_08935 [Pseudolabrys sp.]
MTTLPHAFKRIRLNLARSKEFPQGSARHGYEFVAPLDNNNRIDAELWKQTIAAFAGSGTESRTKLASLFISRVGPSTDAGSLITTNPLKRMTKAAIALAHTLSVRASMFRSAAKTARCTPFRLRPWNLRPERCVV